MNGHILVADIGTTTAKATVFSTSGKTVSFASVAYGFLDRPPGWFEQDPDEVYQAVLTSMRSALEKASQEEPIQPLVISTVCQGGSLIPCDAHGKALYPMLTWMDQRAHTLSSALKGDETGRMVLARTGRPLAADMPLGMILWLKKNETDLYERTVRWMNLNDYVTARLTGKFITDPSSAVLTQLFNVYKEVWDPDILALADIDPAYMSEILPCGAVCGELHQEAAGQTGLPSGIPILNSMHDRTAEAMGLGSFQSGDSWIGTGTAWVACTVADKTPDDRKECNFHALPEKVIRSKLIGGIGTSVEWWVDKLMKKRGIQSRGDALRIMTDLAKESVPGSNGLFFKAFTGAGNEGSFIGETAAHTDADRCRAVYESIAFDFKREFLPFSSNIPEGGHLVLVGGAARSSYWPQIIAEILGSEIEVSNYEHDATLGGAVIAGKYLELAPDYRGVFDIFRIPRRPLCPNRANAEIYQEIWKEYCTL